MKAPLTAVLLAGALAMIPSCKKDKDPNRDLPAATTWHNPAAQGALGLTDERAGGGMHGGDPQGGSGMPNDDVHAGLGMGSVEGGGESPDPDQPIDESKYLEGEIVAGDAVAAAIPANAVIYLSVKMADPNTKLPTGATLAVHRVEATSWPVKFKLTQRNQMRQGDAPVQGEVVLMAWTDQDGEGQTKQPGDVIGQVITKIPDESLRIVLDTVVQ